MKRWKVVNKNGNSYCSIKRYQLSYQKGTLGLFTFDTEENARNFVIGTFCDTRQIQVLKVETLGKETIPSKICCWPSDEAFKVFYAKDHNKDAQVSANLSIPYESLPKLPPFGTICCQSIRVLT